MAKKYPDILRVDFEGRKRKFGGRHNSCPNSPTYHKYAPRLAKKLAERYRDYDNIVAWHISNEFGTGNAYYVATASNEAFYQKFLKEICEKNDVRPVMELPTGVEATSRENDSEQIIFLLNHNDTEIEIDLSYPCQDLFTNAIIPAGNLLMLAKDVRLLAR